MRSAARWCAPSPVPAALAPAATTSFSTAGTAATAPAAPLTALQVRSAQAIVNVFETGEVLGDYGNVSVLPGDTGHLSYGRSQTTLGSGNLAVLIERYAANAGARFGARLAAYLDRLRSRDLTLDGELVLHNLLRASADDPVMRETQDAFFDREYWQPAQRAATKIGLATPLAVALVYDGHVQGSWSLLRDRTLQQAGPPTLIGEHDWVARYIALRRDWLANHPRKDLRKTVYRMDGFQRLVDLGLWTLEPPFVVRGTEISTLTLGGVPPGCWDGPEPGSRELTLVMPMLRGADVRLLQLGLSERGLDLRADGVFGPGTRDRVREFQITRGQPPSGALDAAQVAALAA